MTCPTCNEEIHYQPMAGWYHRGGDRYYSEPDCQQPPPPATAAADQGY